MKDMVRSRRTTSDSLHEGLARRHPIIFNAILILALIALFVAGAFLLSDIMSFKSKVDQKEHSSGLYLTIAKGSDKTIRDWKTKGMELMDQLKSLLGLQSPDKPALKNSTNKAKIQAVLSKNKLAKAKEVGINSVNRSSLQSQKKPSNSSGTQKSSNPTKSTTSLMIFSSGSGGGSDSGSGSTYYSSGSSEDSYSKGSSVTNPTKTAALNYNPNHKLSSETAKNESVLNESILNGPILNEPVQNESKLDDSTMNESIQNGPGQNDSAINESDVNESAFNESILNISAQIAAQIEPQTNQSPMYSKSHGDNNSIHESGTIIEPENNSTGNSSHSLVHRNTTRSSDNLSSGSPAFPSSWMNLATSIRTEIDDRQSPSENDSIASEPIESNLRNNKSIHQNETVDLNHNNSVLEENLQEENHDNNSLIAINDQSDIGSEASGSQSSGSSMEPLSNNTTNTTQHRIGTDLEEIAAPKETLDANNSSSKIDKTKQNQMINLTKSEGSSVESPSSLPSSSGNQTKKVASKKGANSKKVSTSAGSANSNASKKKKSTSTGRFRQLSIPTRSW